jgi:RNA polymerase sigma factor (TIGR02999 family)
MMTGLADSESRESVRYQLRDSRRVSCQNVRIDRLLIREAQGYGRVESNTGGSSRRTAVLSSERAVMQAKASFTQLLSDWRSGEPQALDRLTPIVYDELRRLAHKYMRRERGSHTLQATAVVHEAYLRLIDADVSWQGSAHFFAVAARLMRHILVDHAKARSREKRYGTAKQVPLDTVEVSARDMGYDVIDLDNALERLATLEPRHAQAIELHYFGGLTYEQIADLMKSSPATVHRELRLARAWLISELASAIKR